MEEKDFSDIYKKHYPKVRHYLTRLVGEQEAEDVAQVVFEKVNSGLADFKGEAKLSTWIFRIATNAGLDRLKSPSYKQRPAGPLPLESLQKIEDGATVVNRPSSPDQKVIRNEMSECVREFVDRLPPDYRTIIYLNEIQGFTNREIADILQISIDAAKIRLHRARACLKKSLESGCDFYLNDQSELSCDRKQPTTKD